MKIIGIKAETLQQGEFVFDSLKEAVEKKRVALDDVVLVTRGEDGKVELHQTVDTGFRSKFGDRGLDDKMMKRVGESLADNKAVVFGLGADASIDAVVAKVHDLTDGALQTFVVDQTEKDDDSLVRATAVDYPLPGQQIVRAPYS